MKHTNKMFLIFGHHR